AALAAARWTAASRCRLAPTARSMSRWGAACTARRRTGSWAPASWFGTCTGRRGGGAKAPPDDSGLRHAGEAAGAALGAGAAGELRPLRPLAQRTGAVGVGVAVGRGPPLRRLALLDPVAQHRQAVHLGVERPEPVAESRNHVEAHEAVHAALAELLHLAGVVRLAVVRRDEVVGGAVRHD